MQVWERLLLVHLLCAFERSGLLAKAHRLAFFIDGPLALFGHPAWLSTAITAELQRINAKARKLAGQDLVIVGVEKTGAFVTHFDEIDQIAETGEERFNPHSYFLPTDRYIKQRIIFSDSPKRYGQDTYFGRKFFYKTESGARIVASIPFLEAAQDTLDSDDVSLYHSFGTVEACLLDVDDAGLRMRRNSQRLTEQAFGRRGIAQAREHEVDRGAGGIDGSVEVAPTALDTNVGLIDTPGLIGWLEMTA